LRPARLAGKRQNSAFSEFIFKGLAPEYASAYSARPLSGCGSNHTLFSSPQKALNFNVLALNGGAGPQGNQASRESNFLLP
jgi:hypothetical protein